MYEYLDRRYALALYEVAEKEGKVEEYLEDLKEIIKLTKENDEFLEIIKHPQIPTPKKIQIIKNIFKGRIDDKLLNFIIVLVKKDRMLFIEEKYREMVKIYLQRHNTIVAYVKTAIRLNGDQRRLLTQKLEKRYNKMVILREEIDESVIAGVYLRIDDDVIDYTIKSKFEEIRAVVVDLY